MAVQTRIQFRRDTAANWATAQTAAGATPVLAAGEIGYITSGTGAGSFKIGDGTTLWGSLKLQSDASLLTGDATGLANLTTTGNVIVGGNLTVNGTTTTINSTTLNVDDKNIVLGNVTSSSNTTADGGGITIEATTGGDKTFNWVNATAAWTSSEDLNLLTGKVYEINGSTVLSSTQVLGYSVANANTASAIVARDASGNFAAGTITASLTGTASLATNVVGGTANKGEILYQSGVNTTAELTAPTTNNQVLAYNTSTNAPFWVTPTLSNTYFGSTTTADQLRAALAVANTTGSGSLVFAASPTLVTPALGTPSSGNLASTTGYTVDNLANAGTNVITFLKTPSSANFLNTVTGATGNGGGVVFANNATLVAPTLGVATGTSINVTGQLISTQTTGTAPLSVASTTRVTNLNAATAGVADSATIAGQANNITATANNIIYVGATANTTATLSYSTANNGQVLGISAGQPAFVTPAASGVTNVATGTGLTGGPITSTGTISINTATALTYTTTQRINVSTDVLTFGIRANTTQTANIFEARDGAAAMMMSLSNVGTLFAVTIDGGTA
jgi:hypothetical protein